MILFGKRLIQQHFYVPYPSCCSVDDGVSEGQFVDVSRVSSSNDSGDRNTSAHHSLHHVQISLIQPCVMQSGKKKICRWRYLSILGVKVITHLGQSDGASRAHLPSEGRHLRHTEPCLDGKSPAARGGEPPLWIIRHVSQFTGC